MDESKIQPIKNITKSVIDFLNKIPIFDTLTMEELQTIGKYMQFTKVEEGDVVFKEGDKGTYICFVAYGRLDFEK